MKQKPYSDKLTTLNIIYQKCKTNSERFYIIRKMIDLCEHLIDEGYNSSDINRIRSRLLNIANYGKPYDYSLAENLKEQKIIIADSIQSSPMHLKKLELQNTAIINYPEG
jgi:hypothetical protein